MIKQFAFSLIFLCVYSVSRAEIIHDLNYSIRFDERNSECFLITSSFTTNSEGELLLRIPQSGISALELNSQFTSTEDIAPNLKKFNFPEQRNIGVRYTLCMNNRTYNIDNPIINNTFFQLTTWSAFLLPQYKTNEKLNIKINFENAPKDFNIFSSEGAINAGKINFVEFVSEFETFVVAGSKDKVKEINIQNKKYYAISNNNKTSISFANIKNFEKILSYQTKLMADESTKPTLLIFAVHPDATLYARHFTNTVTMSVPAKTENETLMRAFSHEYFHRWLGWKLTPKDNFNDLLWFMEGVDDYLGVKIAYQSGATTNQGYLNNINNILKEHYLSPIRFLDYKSLSAQSRLDWQHHKIAQLRGNLAALMIDAEKNSELKEDATIVVIKKLLALKSSKSNSDSISITPEMINRYFEETLGIEKWLQINKFIQTGRNLKLPNIFNGGKAKLIKSKVQVADYGFDLDSLFNKRIISDLSSDTPAYKAGLREGMHVISYTIALSRPSSNVLVHVKLNDKTELMEFTPELKYVEIPQYIRTS